MIGTGYANGVRWIKLATALRNCLLLIQRTLLLLVQIMLRDCKPAASSFFLNSFQRKPQPQNLRPVASLVFGFAFAASILSQANSAMAQSSSEVELSGKKFKNVTALADMPADQMGKVMNIMTASLGVNCQFCHDGTDFAKEAVGHKDIGRKMIEMTLELNKNHFEGRDEVSCFTCHRGQKHPAASVAIEPVMTTAGVTQPAVKPTVESIVNKYLTALGGKEKLATLKSRHIVGKRIEPDGRTEPEEVWQTSSGQYRMVTTYGTGANVVAVAELFDGKSAIKKANADAIQLKQDESLLIEREAKLGLGAGLVEAFGVLKFERIAKIEDRNVQVLATDNSSKIRERLFFDEQSGLLVRRTTAVPTVLGDFVHQVDYRDYKVFDGFNVPTKIRFSVPNITWTREVTTVQHDQPVDPALFK